MQQIITEKPTIKRGEYDWVVGMWAKTDYELKSKELPIWANGDPWMARYFIYNTYYYFCEGQVCCSISVVHGFEVKEIQSKHGGYLSLSKMGYKGNINNICIANNYIYSTPAYPNQETEPRLELLEDKPPWFKYYVGQTKMF